MSYYFWLGRDTYEAEAHIEALNVLRREHQESRNYMQGIFEAYGYEEPQASTEALNLTNSDSKSGVREPLDMEADGFVTVHGLRNNPLVR